MPSLPGWREIAPRRCAALTQHALLMGSLDVADLFQPGRIERLSSVIDGKLVPIENGSEARWAMDASGRQWVRKRESDTGFQPLLAEAICWLLGEQLSIRQPRAAVFREDDEWSWMSERVVEASEHWAPDMRDLIANMDEVGRMLTMDAITHNDDRHRRNLLVAPLQDEAHLQIWAIDSGGAKIGWPDDYIQYGMKAPDPHNHARGLPIDALHLHALQGAETAARLDEELLRGIVEEACELAREPQVDQLHTALVQRCRHAHQLVSDYLNALGALK